MFKYLASSCVPFADNIVLSWRSKQKCLLLLVKYLNEITSEKPFVNIGQNTSVPIDLSSV